MTNPLPRRANVARLAAAGLLVAVVGFEHAATGEYVTVEVAPSPCMVANGRGGYCMLAADRKSASVDVDGGMWNAHYSLRLAA